jgi:hypothetical protein
MFKRVLHLYMLTIYTKIKADITQFFLSDKILHSKPQDPDPNFFGQRLIRTRIRILLKLIRSTSKKSYIFTDLGICRSVIAAQIVPRFLYSFLQLFS